MTEFNLSKKIWNDGDEGCHNMFYEEDVKEFIKRQIKNIQEEIDAVPHIANINEVHKLHITSRLEDIKKNLIEEAGDKLK